MRIPLTLLFALGAPLAQAADWPLVYTAGIGVQTPPTACRIGPMPDYEVVHVSADEMDMILGNHAKGVHLLGMTTKVGDEQIIYITNGLPGHSGIYHRVLDHERAHARGCHHDAIKYARL